MKASELKEQRGKLLAELRQIHSNAEREDRNLSPAEKSRFDEVSRQLEDTKVKIELAQTLETEELRQAAIFGKSLTNPEPVTTPGQWRTITGQPVEYRNKANNVRFSDRLDKNSKGLSLGRALRAMVLGDPKLAPEESRAMSTTGASSAVPATVMSQIIDYAFEQSAVMAAGATLIQMPSKVVTIARVTDPGALEIKSENEAFTTDDIAVDGVTLSSFTIGQVFYMSRELAQDAPNFEQAVERTISRLLADAIDNYAINGAGTTEPRGILATSGINTVADYGLVDGWGVALQGWAKVAEDAHNVNGIMMNPLTIAAVDEIGLTSLRERPEALREIPRFVTNKLTATGGTGQDESTVLVGDFSQLLVGIRSDATIETTTEGGDTFHKHQVGVKITWRGDIAVAQPKAFCAVSGITLTEQA